MNSTLIIAFGIIFMVLVIAGGYLYSMKKLNETPES